LAIDAGDPDGVEAELFDRGEGYVVEVGKLSATVLFESAIGDARGVGVAEEARKELVDADFSTCAGNERGGGGRAFDGEREVMGEGAVTWARKKVGVGGAEELAPAVFGRDIFEGGDDLEFSLRGGPRAWDFEFERAGFTGEEFDFGGWVSERGESESVPGAGRESGGGATDKKEVIGLEWKKEGGAGGGFLERDESRSVEA
jgi:hypothetical protein